MTQRTTSTPRTYELGSGFSFQWETSYDVDRDELPVILHLEVDVEDGRLVVVELTARRRDDRPPVTVAALRAIPLASLTALAVTGSSSSAFLDPRGRRLTQVTRGDALSGLAELPELERVAIVYRWGFFIGENPTKWVAEQLQLGYAVAAKRVQAARLAGLLDPTTKGRKGA